MQRCSGGAATWRREWCSVKCELALIVKVYVSVQMVRWQGRWHSDTARQRWGRHISARRASGAVRHGCVLSILVVLCR